jgi:hypothetical protein
MNTSREVFEKVKCAKCDRTLFCNSTHGEGKYLFCYSKFLEEERELMLASLKAIDESINDNCISDAQMMIKNIINQVSGEQI